MSVRNIIQKVERETSVTDIGVGGLSEAPLDSESYGRKNGNWSEVAVPNDMPSPFSTFVYDTVTGTRFINGDIPNSYAVGDTGLTKIYIGDSVTSIGSDAFKNCQNLIGNLVIPNSVISIGSNAFYGCISFDGYLTIGNSVTTIGDSAFRLCGGFQGDLVIPNSVTTIAPRAFRLSGFTGNLIIGNSVTSIGFNAFTLCGFTGFVSIPNSATVIGASAFRDSTSLSTAYLNQPISQLSLDCFIGTNVSAVYIGPDATGWTLGAGQTIGGKSGITVALWTNYPNVP